MLSYNTRLRQESDFSILDELNGKKGAKKVAVAERKGNSHSNVWSISRRRQSKAKTSFDGCDAIISIRFCMLFLIFSPNAQNL
jgi:hypothetical protein